MTQNEVEQIITEALESQGRTGIQFKDVFIGENTLRAKVSYTLNGNAESKEILVLRMDGRWRVLL